MNEVGWIKEFGPQIGSIILIVLLFLGFMAKMLAAFQRLVENHLNHNTEVMERLAGVILELKGKSDSKK